VTEVFDYSRLQGELLQDGGAWINGNNPLVESMTATLVRLEKISSQ
jgi:hypothetical protein